MVADVFPTVKFLFDGVLALFERVFSSLGAWGIFLTGFFIFTLFRLLLRPIAGSYISGGASDTAKKMRGKGEKNYKKGD